MTELTLEKVRLVMLAAEAMRLQGLLPFNQPLGAEALASISRRLLETPIPEIVFRRVIARALIIARNDLSTHLATLTPTDDEP